MNYHKMPLEPRQLLPKEAYPSQEWFDREQVELFSKSWTYVGLASDFPDPGDYATLNVGQYPLLVVRDREGQLRAFHNLCSHRGTELLEGRGNTKNTMICPYHRWSFNLDGSLRGLPFKEECFPDMDKGDKGLQVAALGEFKGMVFVHPDPNPHEEFDTKNW